MSMLKGGQGFTAVTNTLHVLLLLLPFMHMHAEPFSGHWSRASFIETVQWL